MELSSNFLDLTFYRGRVALYALLKALGIGRGDEVLLQAFTCVAVPESLVAAGVVPRYVDVEVGGYNLSPAALEAAITPATRAIVVQHTFGIPAQMPQIAAVAAKHGLFLIEDCCHTLDSRVAGTTVGSWGIGAFYSYEWGKPVVAGVGGSLTVNDARVKHRVEEIRRSMKKPGSARQLRLGVQYLAHLFIYRPSWYWPIRSLYHHLGAIGAAESNYNPLSAGEPAADFSLQMADVVQRRAEHKLRRLHEITAHSIAITARYAAEIRSGAVIHPERRTDAVPVFARYPLRAGDKAALLAAAKQCGVELAEWYATPVHPLSSAEAARVGYQAGSCPEAEKRCREVVSLPTHRKVTKRDVSRAIDFLNRQLP